MIVIRVGRAAGYQTQPVPAQTPSPGLWLLTVPSSMLLPSLGSAFLLILSCRSKLGAECNYSLIGALLGEISAVTTASLHPGSKKNPKHREWEGTKTMRRFLLVC